MKYTAIRTAWLLLLPAISSAGVYIETVTRDIKSGTTSLAQKLHVQGGMAQMTPEQRAQMQQLMGALGGAVPNAKPDVYEAVDTGRNETAAGRGCRVWNIKRNGVVEDEYCVVPFSSLPGKEDVQALMRRMGEMSQSLQQAMPNVARSGGMMRAYDRINGYPVRQRDIVAGKPAGTEDLLKAWLEQPVPAAMFEIPAGYTRKDMPTGMRARGGDKP